MLHHIDVVDSDSCLAEEKKGAYNAGEGERGGGRK